MSDTSAGLFRLEKGPSYIFHLDKDPRVEGHIVPYKARKPESPNTGAWFQRELELL